jgi:hypothetical protein
MKNASDRFVKLLKRGNAGEKATIAAPPPPFLLVE